MSDKKIDSKDTVTEIEEIAEEVVEALIRRARETGTLPFVTACPTVSDRVSLPGLQTLSKDELASLYALLAYASHQQDVQQETVQAMLEARFCVRHISQIKSADFERTIAFLAELRVSDQVN